MDFPCLMNQEVSSVNQAVRIQYPIRSSLTKAKKTWYLILTFMAKKDKVAKFWTQLDESLPAQSKEKKKVQLSNMSL